MGPPPAIPLRPGPGRVRPGDDGGKPARGPEPVCGPVTDHPPPLQPGPSADIAAGAYLYPPFAPNPGFRHHSALSLAGIVRDGQPGRLQSEPLPGSRAVASAGLR